jgi:hypothetical protein
MNPLGNRDDTPKEASAPDVEIQGGDPVLRNGTVFRWTTFGLAIESKVHA